MEKQKLTGSIIPLVQIKRYDFEIKEERLNILGTHMILNEKLRTFKLERYAVFDFIFNRELRKIAMENNIDLRYLLSLILKLIVIWDLWQQFKNKENNISKFKNYILPVAMKRYDIKHDLLDILVAIELADPEKDIKRAINFLVNSIIISMTSFKTTNKDEDEDKEIGDVLFFDPSSKPQGPLNEIYKPFSVEEYFSTIANKYRKAEDKMRLLNELKYRINDLVDEAIKIVWFSKSIYGQSLIQKEEISEIFKRVIEYNYSIIEKTIKSGKLNKRSIKNALIWLHSAPLLAISVAHKTRAANEVFAYIEFVANKLTSKEVKENEDVNKGAYIEAQRSIYSYFNFAKQKVLRYLESGVADADLRNFYLQVHLMILSTEKFKEYHNMDGIIKHLFKKLWVAQEMLDKLNIDTTPSFSTTLKMV